MFVKFIHFKPIICIKKPSKTKTSLLKHSFGGKGKSIKIDAENKSASPVAVSLYYISF